MSSRISIFKSAAHRASFLAAYDATLSLWPVSYESIKVPTRFGATHVICSGPKDGEPLMLLHAASAGATMWFDNVGALSQKHRTYAVDTIGDAGRSVMTQLPRQRSDYAGWLGDVLKELGLERAGFVGSSYGGWLTMGVAFHSPDLVRKAILLSPANSFTRLSMLYGFRILPSMLFPIRPFINNSIRPLFGKPPNAIYYEQLAQAATCRLKMVWPKSWLDAELRQIETPTLLLMGSQEVILASPDATLKRAARLMPNIQTGVIADAGHLMSIDQPELVNLRILDFLAAEGSGDRAKGFMNTNA